MEMNFQTELLIRLRGFQYLRGQEEGVGQGVSLKSTLGHMTKGT